jgi:hypothetical protein
MKFLVLTYAVVSAIFAQDFKLPAPLAAPSAGNLWHTRFCAACLTESGAPTGICVCAIRERETEGPTALAVRANFEGVRQ